MAEEARFMDIVEAFLSARGDIARALGVGPRFEELSAAWLPVRTDLSPRDALERMGSIAGIDGGSHLVEVNLGQSLFAVSSTSVAFRAGERPEPRRVFQVGVIDFFKAEDRVRIYREALEAKMAAVLAIGREVDYVLLDGSLEANLAAEPVFRGARPGRYAGLSEEERELIVSAFLRVVRNLPLASALTVITATAATQATLEEAARDIVGGDGEGEGRKPLLAVSAMERLEQGVSLLALVAAAERAGVRVVAVAKRSSARSHFRSTKPDLAIVQRYTRGPGRTPCRVREVEVGRHILRAARAIVGPGVGATIRLTTLYARLARSAAPVKLEILGDLEEDEVDELVGNLAGIAVLGYPYPLRRAHELAKITRSDMEAGLRSIGFVPEFTGREALGE
ncbi:MAG: DNA double-strand break repair nuclease NurA [Candidatus Korarchaeota archaeon]|nr:DNA double-strand break repair nuclease NurA [Candidatus Korarchaeota archaeon]